MGRSLNSRVLLWNNSHNICPDLDLTNYLLLHYQRELMLDNHNWHPDLLRTLAMRSWLVSMNLHQVSGLLDINKTSNSFHPCRPEHQFIIQDLKL
jgi:hypothetical protein